MLFTWLFYRRPTRLRSPLPPFLSLFYVFLCLFTRITHSRKRWRILIGHDERLMRNGYFDKSSREYINRGFNRQTRDLIMSNFNNRKTIMFIVP